MSFEKKQRGRAAAEQAQQKKSRSQRNRANAIAHRRQSAREQGLWHVALRHEGHLREAARFADAFGVGSGPVFDISHHGAFLNRRQSRQNANATLQSLALDGAHWQEQVAPRRRLQRERAALERFFADNFAAALDALRRKTRKSALQKSFAVGIRVARRRFERHRQQSPRFFGRAVDLRRRCHQTVARLTRIAGFEAVALIPAKQQFVAVHHHPLRPDFPVAANRRGLHPHHLRNKRLFQRGASHHRQIVRRSEMIRVVQTVRIDKMGVAAAQFARFLVHPRHESRLIAAHAFGNRHARIIGRMHQGRFDEFPQGVIFAFQKPDAAFASVGRVFSGANDLIQIAVFDRDQAGHDFGRRGRKKPRVRVFRLQNAARIEIENESRGGGWLGWRRSLSARGEGEKKWKSEKKSHGSFRM